MHDLTILSIFRNSAAYLGIYEVQMHNLCQRFPGVIHFCWLVGDSADDTASELAAIAEHITTLYNATATLTTFNHGGPPYASIDHPERWKQLASVWNRNLDELTPTRYAVCVESDLIWQASDLLLMLDHLNNDLCDVAYPLLMLRNTEQFYDTHAYKAPDGTGWSAWPPYAPGWDGTRFVPVSQAGGMVVTRGETLADARWGNDDCVLHFPAGTRCMVDMHTWIKHP